MWPAVPPFIFFWLTHLFANSTKLFGYPTCWKLTWKNRQGQPNDWSNRQYCRCILVYLLCIYIYICPSSIIIASCNNNDKKRNQLRIGQPKRHRLSRGVSRWRALCIIAVQMTDLIPVWVWLEPGPNEKKETKEGQPKSLCFSWIEPDQSFCIWLSSTPFLVMLQYFCFVVVLPKNWIITFSK